jgi:hypothetical protein
MSKLIAIVYPYDQESVLEQQLSMRVQVEKLVNPTNIDAYRYDKILVIGRKDFFSKSTLDKLSILSEKYPNLFDWVEDEYGKAADILHSNPTASQLGAFQSQGSCEIQIQEKQKFTLLFAHKRDVFSEWRMKVRKGGSGLASLTVFDADLGGKLLRTYDFHLSEFTDGWFSFKFPNPIFKAQKKFAVSIYVKQMNGPNPIWYAHQGWSEHTMLLNQSKSDLICCFETL